MIQPTDILIFVEDPGAANYVAELPSALIIQGWKVRLFANGTAYDYLTQRGIAVESGLHLTSTESILAEIPTRLLLIGTAENPDTLGLALVARARSAGITSIGVVDALANADYRFRGRSNNPLAYAPDWLLVPNELTKTAYVGLGYPAQQISICGHPHYDYVHVMAAQLSKEPLDSLRQRLFPDVLAGQKVVVFASEVSTGLNAQQYCRSAEYTLQGWGTSNRRTEVVLEEFLDAVKTINPRPYLVLRLHPKNNADEFTTYLHEFNLISSGGAPLELIYAADCIVGMTTILLLEAALMGKETLSIVPRPVEQEWLPSIGMGLTSGVTTREQLRVTLADVLRDTPQVPKFSQENAFVFGSLQQVLRFITELLNRKL
ncbi:MAG: hypothetical protein U0401_10545 [Anaerolineae bacterium]